MTGRDSPFAVFATFLALGCRSFGGPVAHLAVFREAFVERRRWLGEHAYAELVALCQFLPGPTSSQVGMLLGWRRAGLAGMAAAWLGFTLPSAALMIAAGAGAPWLAAAAGGRWIAGVQCAVLAVVAAAVLAMARQLCPDPRRGAIAAAAAAAVLLAPAAWWQLPVLALAGLAGALLPRPPAAVAEADPGPLPGRGLALAALLLLLAGLLFLPFLAGSPWGRTAADLFRDGCLVFGGGHVVLPLLAADVVDSGRLTAPAFLAGYGLAQAVPGPMFSFAGFLGAALHGPGPGALAGGLLAVAALFLPGALIALAALPAWARLRRAPVAAGAAEGLGAGVVGILAAACYDPVFISAVHRRADLALAVAAFAALVALRLPAWAVVTACAGVATLQS